MYCYQPRPIRRHHQDQAKINSLNGQLARAKARRDVHLIKQLERQLHVLNPYFC